MSLFQTTSVACLLWLNVATCAVLLDRIYNRGDLPIAAWQILHAMPVNGSSRSVPGVQYLPDLFKGLDLSRFAGLGVDGFLLKLIELMNSEAVQDLLYLCKLSPLSGHWVVSRFFALHVFCLGI